MNYQNFLTRVIDEGIQAARKDYDQPDEIDKLTGSVAGFEACRDKSPTELKTMLTNSRVGTFRAREDHRREAGPAQLDANFHGSLTEEAKGYWWYRCFEAEVEWVCNVVSAMLLNEGRSPIATVTARGMMKAAEIVGVANVCAN